MRISSSFTVSRTRKVAHKGRPVVLDRTFTIEPAGSSNVDMLFDDRRKYVHIENLDDTEELTVEVRNAANAVTRTLYVPASEEIGFPAEAADTYVTVSNDGDEDVNVRVVVV